MTLYSLPAFVGNCWSGAGAAADVLVAALLAVISASTIVDNDDDFSLLFTDASSVFVVALHRDTY